LVHPNRLAAGGLIDRGRPLSFHFDGRRYSGFQGDTLASALLAHDVRLIGRSFKYHRPRGVLSAGVEEPNALVELGSGARREPNTRATVVELFAGLEAYSQNRWPSLACDVGSLNSLLSPLLPAGFYYKTFMWPASFWEKLYEPLIRHAAGLGRASHDPDPDIYEKIHAFCDVLIIGGGPAGLAAALAAGRAGARVLLCEEDFVLGGRLNAERREIGGKPGALWAQEVESELASLPEVRVLRRACVFGAYDGGCFGALERVADHQREPFPHQARQRLWRIIAKRAVLAAGAIERPVVFGGNDRPGVMMASAVRTYLNRFSVVSGRRIAVFTCSDDAWTTAFDLKAAGIDIEAVIDARVEVDPSLITRASRLGIPRKLGSHVIATRGARALCELTVRDSAGRCARLAADTLAMSGGWNPNLALCTHLGGRPRWSEEIAAFVPGDVPCGMAIVGAARGSWSLVHALHEGRLAGIEAAEAAGFRATASSPLHADDEPAALRPVWFVGESKGKAFVDFQNDVTCEDLALSVREGFKSAEHLKRYTTLGMGTDQGRTSNVNGLAVLAALTGQPIAAVGVTAFRPPYTPVAIGALAGAHRGKEFRPTRLTPAHRWAEEYGATFVEVGPWLRAQWFAAPGETDWLQTVAREVKAVRTGVGVCDVSTLGRIEVHGPDAGVFLDRIYTNMFSTLPVGKARYGLMLREDGFIMDDGTCARLAADHYVMSTTTANAEKVVQHLDHALQVLWPQLDVQITPITEHWAQYSIAGPLSRQLLTRLLGNAIDLSNDAFPFLACAEFDWRGLRARLFRISFSGELAYELAVPARFGDSTIRAIMQAGAEWNVTPYGMEALNVLRLEKGHVVISEINGTTTAADLGFSRLMSTKKDYIGRVLAQREGLTAPDRPVLIGIRAVDRTAQLNAGAHFLAAGAPARLENDEGYVTSVAFSPTLGHWVGLGLLRRGRERIGARVIAHDPVRSSSVEVEVVSPVFIDPEGTRVHL
jgi:heterotetrameric sarcosine oxidase alpha subunit